MKKSIISILLIAVSLISFSQVTISGIVKDAFNNKPLEKAIVSINGKDYTVITEADGSFLIVLKESGVYDFKITKINYETIAESLILNENMDIEISLNSTIGKLHSTNTINEENNSSEKIEETEFEINLENLKGPSNTVDTEKTTKTKPVIKRVNSSTSMTQNKNSNSFTLSGTIKDKESSEVISKAVISFEGMKKTYITTHDGLFKFRLSKGTYTMYVKMKGYKHEVAKIPVTENLNITILLSKNKIKEITTEDVVVIATRATTNTPTAFSKITKEEIQTNNLGKDLPYLLELSPSVVASSDGGNGVGYTSMRIRGSDMTRINFTLNGFPVNDAESQGVFLVDLPDLASDIENVQIQRGIGTSTNGSGAFGASVNINTNVKREKAYAEFNNSFGSFNTLKNTIKAGTGLIYDHFTFDGRFSHLMTDGYIDRAEAKMFAYSFSAGYYNKNSVVKFNIFAGKEKTYQAWNGVDYNTMETDRTFNSAGTDYNQIAVPYKNEIDNYDQTNYQLSLSHQFTKNISANVGFHFTNGRGYYEQYKFNQELLNYGVILPTQKTDLVRRKWLDNYFGGTIFSVNYKIEKFNATLGGALSKYDGDHFGEIIWTKDAQGVGINEYYYLSNGKKSEFNSYLKAEYKLLKNLILFGDIQYRKVGYIINGVDDDQRLLSTDKNYNFINPKFGATYLMGEKLKSKLYASFAMANREPTRNDFLNREDPKHENMMDFEVGFKHKSKKFSYEINSFYMKYKDQLVLTGELNDVGSAIRENVENSFRTGIELSGAYALTKHFGLNGAATWSINEIEYFETTNYDGSTTIHDKTKIAYSPALLANLTLYMKDFKGVNFSLTNKYIGKQYLDNTTNNDNILKAYYLLDARIGYTIKPKFMQEIELVFKANNLFNTKYSSNGYVYYGSPYYYPQAGINVEGGINLKF